MIDDIDFPALDALDAMLAGSSRLALRHLRRAGRTDARLTDALFDIDVPLVAYGGHTPIGHLGTFETADAARARSNEHYGLGLGQRAWLCLSLRHSGEPVIGCWHEKPLRMDYEPAFRTPFSETSFDSGIQP